MPDDPRILELLEVMLETGRSAEDVCQDAPELLSAVRQRWATFKHVEAQLEEVFPSQNGSPTMRPHNFLLADTKLPQIPGYEVESLLGFGGMGVVYKARHIKLNRHVALKMLLAGPYASKQELLRFLREAESVASLQHAHIVQVHDIGEFDDRPYFTMEFVEGGTLAAKLAGAPQPAREAAQLVATLARAVHIAHEHKVVHRDLKPANIMLMADGSPKITDFGLAQRFGGESALTYTGARIGSPSYMAPEQALGTAGAFCPGVDIYALGAILYEMLTGRPPFRAESAAETQRQVISQQPALPTRLNAQVPRDLETICLKCLSKEPRRRYCTAADLADDLDRFLKHEPIRARRVGVFERGWRWIQRNPTGAALIATALALVVLAISAGAREIRLAAQQQQEIARWGPRLEFIMQLEREARFPEARAILGRIPDGGSDALRAQIERADRELTVLEQLEAIRVRRLTASHFDFGRAEMDASYENVFRSAGLGVPGDDVDEVASRIKAMDVHQMVVSSLYDWAYAVRDRPRLQWLLTVAKRVDPEPKWRDAVRTPTNWDDADKMKALAARTDFANESVPLLLMLGGVMDYVQGDAATFYRNVQSAHPDDFWATFALAESLDGKNDADAIGYYRAAIAIRPRAVAAHVNLGNTLSRIDRTQEAVEAYERALAIDPDSGVASLNFALIYSNANQFAEAERLARHAVQSEPQWGMAHSFLGSVLLKQFRNTEARPALERALELMSDADPMREVTQERLELCTQMISLESKLSEVAAGREEPSNTAECHLLAELALRQKEFALSAGLFDKAMHQNRSLADDVTIGARYNAACAAAQAGLVSGGDTAGAAEARAWRDKARAWLHEDLDVWENILAQGDGDFIQMAHDMIAHWLTDADLASVRDDELTGSYDVDERDACRRLWGELNAIYDRLQRMQQ